MDTTTDIAAISDLPRLQHLEILLDRSSSMERIKSEAENGLEEFLDAQDEAGVPTTVTLAQFDDEYELVYEIWPLEEVPRLVLQPRGRTALLDAIAKTLRRLEKRILRTPQGWQPDSVIVVIVTDGHENASRQYARDEVHAMIRRCQKKHGWTFLFLGADQDAIEVAGSLGISADTALSYDSGRTEASLTTAGRMVARGTTTGHFAFTDQDRQGVE
ncbi:vWA domain-containing protein [Actinomadura kijaniata]|uniref:vWA domain-containing protein n=1 Tax=Actinomadura kijaniata TaxID=46161 RepID=UPI00082E17DE|nr:vWA domain-containing protein [Actinomadura kijaniata]